jgi:hypothetical protein|tara:strand:- start:45 stop:293 length:249 start_codon:yes stop_codon:yes gene_type:complete
LRARLGLVDDHDAVDLARLEQLAPEVREGDLLLRGKVGARDRAGVRVGAEEVESGKAVAWALPRAPSESWYRPQRSARLSAA